MKAEKVRVWIGCKSGRPSISLTFKDRQINHVITWEKASRISSSMALRGMEIVPFRATGCVGWSAHMKGAQ